MAANNEVAAIRIRRLIVTPVVDHYGRGGELLRTVPEKPVELCEADFGRPIAEWLIAAGVPPEVLGLVPRGSGGQSADTAATSSTVAGSTLLPHEYVTAGADDDLP